MSNESPSSIVSEFLVKPSQVAPTLFVGLGGAGCKMVNRIYKQLKRRPDFKERFKPLSKFAYVDTNIHDLEKYRDEGDDLFLISDFEKAEYSRLAAGKAYLDADDYFTQWVPQNYRFRSGDTAGAGQIRIESRLGVYYQVKHKDYVQRFRNLIEGLKDHAHGHRRLDSSEIRIVLAYSVAGGTGSGAHLPMAYLLRDLASQFGKPLVFGVAAISSVFEDKVGTNKDGVFANGYAALKETEYLMKLGAPESKFFPEDGTRVFHYNPNDRSRRTVDSKPFEVLWVIDRPESFSVKDVLDAAGDAIYLQMYTPIYGEQAGDFDNYTQHQRFLVPHDFEAKGIPGYTSFYGALGAAVLHVPDESLLQYCSRRGSLAVIENSFLQGIPSEAVYGAVRENARAFYEVVDIDGSGRMVQENDFARRDDTTRRRLRNKLFQKRVRLLARAELDANEATSFFQQVFWHGHGARGLPEVDGSFKAVDVLNLPGAPTPLEIKLKGVVDRLADERVGKSMAHFVLNALERRDDSSDPVWHSRVFSEALEEVTAEFEGKVKKYVTERSTDELKSEGMIFKSEKMVAKKTSRSVMEQRVDAMADEVRGDIAKTLDRVERLAPDAADWVPGFDWMSRLAFLTVRPADEKNLVEKRYAVLALLDRIEEITQGLEEEKKRRREVAMAEAKRGPAAPPSAGAGEDPNTIVGVEIQNHVLPIKKRNLGSLDDSLFQEYANRIGALQQKLVAYAGVFTDLQSQFEPVRAQEVAAAEKLRIEGTRDETEAFVLDGEALQIESGRRMWDFYYEDQIRNLSDLSPSSNPELARIIVAMVERLVDAKMRGEPTPGGALSTLYRDVGQAIAGALRHKIVGDLRSKVETNRNGLTLLEALAFEIRYRAIYLTNREAIDGKGPDAIAAAVGASRGDMEKLDIRSNLHLDYLKDKTKRLIKERSDLLCYFDEKHLSQGGVRADEVFLAAIHETLYSGLLKDVLNESLGIRPPKVITKDVEDRKQVVFYRAVLNVPLYVFGRLRELRSCYYQFKGMAKRSKVLHIDKNWEDTLPDLDPASVEEAHRQQRIRDSVLDFGTLMSVPLQMVFDAYIDEAKRHELGYEALLGDVGYGISTTDTCIEMRELSPGNRVWVMRMPLEARIARVRDGSLPGEVDQDEPVIGTLMGEAVLRAQEVLAESPSLYEYYRQTCAQVREGKVPRVIQSLIRIPGEWRRYREGLKTRYGRNPREDQQRMLDDIDNVQQKLTDALVQLYETLDLRRREAGLRMAPVGLDDAVDAQSRPSDDDPVFQSITLLNNFRNALKSAANPVVMVAGKRPSLFEPLKPDALKRGI